MDIALDRLPQAVDSVILACALVSGSLTALASLRLDLLTDGCVTMDIRTQELRQASALALLAVQRTGSNWSASGIEQPYSGLAELVRAHGVSVDG